MFPIAILRYPTTAAVREPRFVMDNDSLVINYFLGDPEQQGLCCTQQIRFSNVAAVRSINEPYVETWIWEQAYDQLVILNPSPWLNELTTGSPITNKLHHFAIVVDSFGSTEVLATDAHFYDLGDAPSDYDHRLDQL